MNMQRGIWQATAVEGCLDTMVALPRPSASCHFLNFLALCRPCARPKSARRSHWLSHQPAANTGTSTCNPIDRPKLCSSVEPTNSANMSPTKEAAMAASLASSSGAAFVTPHKHRTSSGSISSKSSATPSASAAVAATATPTPTRYLPLLREIQDMQEMNSGSLSTSASVSDISTAASSLTAAPAAVAASPTTNSTFFTGSSFGVF